MPSHKTAAVLMSLLLATTAYAVDEVTPIDVCRDISIIAREIMTARQTGKPMSETLPIAIERFKDWTDKYEIEFVVEVEEMAADLVMAAYDIPAYPIERLQQREISEFENELFADCYEGMTSDSEEVERQPAGNERLKREAESNRLEAMQADAKAAYMFAIQQRISRNWVKPPTATAGIECVVNIRQLPGGEVVSVSIGTCNADSAVRRSIEAAVHRASPLPQPADPSAFDRDITLIFRPED